MLKKLGLTRPIYRFNTIAKRDRQTDGRTDRITDVSISRVSDVDTAIKLLFEI